MLPILVTLLGLLPQTAATGTTVAAQDAPPPANVHVRLSIKDDRRTFRIGEPIELVLTFTADRPGDQAGLDAPALEAPVDTIEISPATGVVRWIDNYVTLHPPYRDVEGVSTITTAPLEVTLPLNYWFRFDEPGDFTVRVITRRASRDRGSLRGTPLATNVVSFRLARMSEHDEAIEAARLGAGLAAMTKRDEDRESELCTALGFLTGEAGAREKVRALSDPPQYSGEQCARALREGMYLSRNPDHLRGLLEAAIRDPATPVNSQMLDALVDVRLWLETPGLVADFAHDPEALHRRAGTRVTEIRAEYFDELVRSLALRADRSRRETASTILSATWQLREHRSLPAAARRILIDEFDQFDDDAQTMLVASHWSDIRDRSLLPALARLAGSASRIWHGTLLGAMIDIAPAEARPFVVHEILTQTLVDVRLIRGLPDPTLPELDRPLAARLERLVDAHDPRSSSEFENTARLIARFAGDAILADVRSLFDERGASLDTGARACLLAYLDRWDEAAMRPQIERALAEPGDGRLLDNLAEARFGGSVAAILRARLESDDPIAAAAAAGKIEQYGPADTRALLEARLTRWRKDWRGRESLLESVPGTVTPQGALEIALVGAIRYGTAWKVSDDDVKALQQGCLTAACRRSFR